METYDAVVVGAGPNGLVAANHLAEAGWSVLVLEAQPDVGGAVRSAEDVHPGFVHDTFSSFYPLTVASRATRDLDLAPYGLDWCHAPAVLGHPFPDGTWALLHRDRELTAGLMERQAAGDGDAWIELCEQWDRIGEAVVGAVTSPFPPVWYGLKAAVALARPGSATLVKELLSPMLSFGDLRFTGTGPQILMAGNAGHSDIPPDAPGSAAFGLLMTMLGQTVGFPVPKGGAGVLSTALARRVEALGGRVVTRCRVDRIIVHGRTATGVETEHGDRIAARRAVVADVVAPKLYGGLVPTEALPARTVRAMRAFQLDPSTVKVDWALDGPIPWASEPPLPPGTFHVAHSLEEMAVAQAQLASGAVPAKPFMLAGQMTTCDPSRSPAGTEAVWAYTHVPQKVRADAGDDGLRGAWDHDECERFADRMQARIEELAPGFGSRVLARRILGPRELEFRDGNLVGGAINGGTSQLQQEMVLRPVPGLGRAETPVRKLYLGSASAHPGGGVHGACGMNAARAALAHHRTSRLFGGS